MIKFKVLAIKIETNKLYGIFLLKKNVQAGIIKIIPEYSPMAAPGILREWKITIISVG